MKKTRRSDRAPIDVEGLKARKPDAQLCFWTAERPVIASICMKILRNAADADEATDGVMIDFMYGEADRLEHVGAARSFLQLMATRRAIRRRDRRETHNDSALPFLPDDGNEDPVERAHVAGLVPRLDPCLGELTPKAQRVINLRYADGEITNEQIGRLVGDDKPISKQYIGRLITKSLAALKICLERGMAQKVTAQ